jgi:hypothetical protein
MPIRQRGYMPQFDLDLKRGEIGEKLAEALLTEAMQPEVKTQLRAIAYGSVFVETEVRGRPDGIRHPAKTADWWVFVLGRDGVTPERAVMLRATDLARLVDRIEATRGLSEAPSGSHPGRGARVYLAELVGLETRPARPAAHPVQARGEASRYAGGSPDAQEERPARHRRRSLRPRGATLTRRG